MAMLNDRLGKNYHYKNDKAKQILGIKFRDNDVAPTINKMIYDSIDLGLMEDRRPKSQEKL